MVDLKKKRLFARKDKLGNNKKKKLPHGKKKKRPLQI